MIMISTAITKDRIKNLAQECGFHACGIVEPKPIEEAEKALHMWTKQGKHGDMKYMEDYEERKNRFWEQFPNAKSVIVLGINYFSSRPKSAAPVASTPGTGRIARYAWGKDYHLVLSKKIDQLKKMINQEIGNNFYCESAVDTKPLLERSLAEQAGIGFIGKQTQLLSLQFGPWLFLSELITNIPFEPDEPFSGNCGTCRLCIDECPTEAIQPDGYLDARKCIAYLTIEHKNEIPADIRPKIGNWLFGCDECLNICPYTAKQKETDCEELTEKNGFGSGLNLIELFGIKSNRQYQKYFNGTALLRASRKQLLRNAAVVLGNLGNKEALGVLKKALADQPLIREHAAWAIQKIEKLD